MAQTDSGLSFGPTTSEVDHIGQAPGGAGGAAGNAFEARSNHAARKRSN
jgi:hypothetical protein